MQRRVFKLCAVAIILTGALSFMTVEKVNAKEVIEVPEEVLEVSEELGGKYNICPELIQAVCYVESRFQADAENCGCIGIMQVSEKWHKDRMKKLGVTDLKDIRQNMTVAVDYLASLVEEEKDPEEALMRYHGEKNIEEKLESGELSKYVEKVLTISEQLERANGK